VFLDENGERITDPEVLDRLRDLAIPPAWQDVWICSDPLGHLQATGVDAAGRKQYLYHPRWREHRDRQKFERVLKFGAGLPRVRRQLKADLRDGEPTHEAVLACAVRLLDIGMFRIGSEQYADEEGGIGLATIRKEHVSVHGPEIEFDYLAKGGLRRRVRISDALTRELLVRLRRRRGGAPELLVHREGRRWVPVRSDEINEYIKSKLGEEFTAKDFRTWNATVMAAVSVAAESQGETSKTARKRVIDKATRAVAELLGNTPAVARRAYIDPRVFDRYLSGWTITGVLAEAADLDPADDQRRQRVERGVLDLLADNTDSPAVERVK